MRMFVDKNKQKNVVLSMGIQIFDLIFDLIFRRCSVTDTFALLYLGLGSGHLAPVSLLCAVGWTPLRRVWRPLRQK